MNFRTLTLNLALIFSLVFAAAKTLAVDFKNIYPQALSASMDLLKKCPVKDCYWVGIGSSPSPLIAIAQNLGIPSVNIPFSAKGVDLGWGFGHEDLDRVVEKVHLTPEIENLFLRLVPRPEELGNRSIVLIDYAVSGKNLIVAEILFRKFLDRHDPGRGIKTIALFRRDHSVMPRWVRDSDFLFIGMKLDEALRESELDNYREYPSYRIARNHPADLQKRAGYEWLRWVFYGFMEKDQRLLEKLSSSDELKLTPPAGASLLRRPALWCGKVLEGFKNSLLEPLLGIYN